MNSEGTSGNLYTLQAKETRQEKATAFLHILPKRGPRAFKTFIEALIKSEQEFIAEKLDKRMTQHCKTQRGEETESASVVDGPQKSNTKSTDAESEVIEDKPGKSCPLPILPLKDDK